VVAHHHERWDGAGYPNRLAGEEIPLAARIIALADSVDALCSTRPYRQKLEFVQVMEEIGRCSGRQFDPEVVAAFFELAAEKGAAFFRDSAAAPD
jgi:ribonuclease P protein subunit RPR2